MRNLALTLAALALIMPSCSSSSDDDPGVMSPASPASPGTDTAVEENRPGSEADVGAGAVAEDAAEGSADGESMEGTSDGLPLAEGGAAGESGGEATDEADTAEEPAGEEGAPPEGEPTADDESGDSVADGTMSFFVTSEGMGDGGNLGGLAGADAFCAELAAAVSPDFARRTWHAYLSTSMVDARDRIGTGPWHNADGDVVANSLEQLHDAENVQAGGPLDATWAINDLTVPLDETGAQVPSGGGGGNVHDILTGTLLDGTAAPGLNCNDWTSNEDAPDVSARIGHSNRTGLAGQRQLFNDVHDVGCSQDGARNVTQGGGRGSFYCFAVITGE
jgi:hypothetical protein